MASLRSWSFASWLLLSAVAPAQDVPGGDETFYAERVRPILEQHCFECHGAEGRAKGGLRLATRTGFLAGGDSGPVQEDGGAFDASLFLEAIGYEDEFLQMPPTAKLADEDLATLRAWIALGAPYDGTADMPAAEAEEEHEPRLTRDDGLTGWAYRPVVRPEVPPVASHPIDAFVRQRLTEAGLAPNPRADERALVRRVHLDLIGLAPSPEEVEAYVRNDAPDKWERLVETLLASPHYGERWGRHWLDVVRYAETNGFERDSNKPNIWRYRDWVVDAFNRDMPYDRFVMEQLAGDELADRDRSSLVASGYLRLQQWDDEPGAGALQGRYDVLDDIVSTTGQVFLGSTIGCARCHDHKSDPFDAEHYYEFMAFFHGLTDMSTGGTQADVSTPEEAQRADALEAERRAENTRLEGERRAFVERFLGAARERDGATGAAPGPLAGLRYRFYRDTWATLPDFEMFRPEDVGELPAGYVDLAPRTRDDAIGFVQEGRLGVPHDGTYELRLRADDGARVLVGGEERLRIDGLGDEPRRAKARFTLAAGEAPFRLEWFHAKGEPVLELDWRRVDDALWRYTTEPAAADEAWTSLEFDDAAWAVGEAGFGARGTPGADVRTEWREEEIRLRRTFEWDGADPCVVVHHDEDVELWINGVLALERHGYVGEYVLDELTPAGRAALRRGHNVLAVRCRQTAGGQYVDVAVVPRAATTDGRSLRDVAFGRRPLSTPDSVLSDDEVRARVAARADDLLGPGSHERFSVLERELEHARQQKVPRAMAFVARERGADVPPLSIHVRGNANVTGKEVQPDVPEFLCGPELPPITPPADNSSSGRRTAFARWVTAPDHPLTARVMVNRVWQHHFGQGILSTPNDFGELGERPTHPELLDWLASEFIARGWSVKELHRLVLTSETWRQSARGRDDALAVDPANTLLWRMSPRRLGAEEVRDHLLAVAGLLNLEMGGPSVFGRMPAAALATSSTPHSVWGESPEEQRNRRTLYIKVKRSLLTPFLLAHDMADVDASCPARFTTILPTQALQMLNGEFPHEMAARFADRLERELPERASGASGGLVAARVRRAIEVALSRPATEDEVESLTGLAVELQEVDGLAPRQALELVCLTVLNLNELVFVD